MRVRPIVARSAVAVAALVLAAGCAGGDSGGAGSGASASSAQPTSSAAAGASGVGLTKPGTTLKVGERAVVPFEYADYKGTLGLTVTSIDKGDPADLAALQLGDRAAGMTPYYVRITVDNEGGTDLSNVFVHGWDGLLADGDQAQAVSVIGSFDKCDDSGANDGFTTKGATFQMCHLALAGQGTAVTAAQYGDGDYSDKPVVWKQ